MLHYIPSLSFKIANSYSYFRKLKSVTSLFSNNTLVKRNFACFMLYNFYSFRQIVNESKRYLVPLAVSRAGTMTATPCSPVSDTGVLVSSRISLSPLRFVILKFDDNKILNTINLLLLFIYHCC